jgi:hypothetical protein
MRTKQESSMRYFRMGLTTAVMLFAFFMAFSGSADAKSWAFGTIGTLLGYWLKGL